MQLMEKKAGLVTGAGSGIGRAGAIAFANHGGKVIVSDYNEDSGKETVALIKEAGGQAEFFRCDVSEEEQVKALVDFAVGTYGTLDFAFNNAGIDGGCFAPVGEMDSAVFDRVMKINLYGVFYCMKYEVLAMEANGGGAIVNTSSSNGLIGIPRNPPYNASKFGVIGLTRNGAIDYGQKGVRVNALAPGPTATTMLTGALEHQPPEVKEAMYASLPMRDLLEPEDQANAAVWLCSDQARMITGVTLPVDGGFTA
ncbi:SDR family NAD(P)-dependent oxidoreductase [Pseudarthrobacter siccitolerans]